MLNNQFRVIVNNPFENIGQGDLNRASELGNLSIERPTVQEMNNAVAGGSELRTVGNEDTVEPAFGEHLREAADAFRRMVR